MSFVEIGNIIVLCNSSDIDPSDVIDIAKSRGFESDAEIVEFVALFYRELNKDKGLSSGFFGGST